MAACPNYNNSKRFMLEPALTLTEWPRFAVESGPDRAGGLRETVGAVLSGVRTPPYYHALRQKARYTFHRYLAYQAALIGGLVCFSIAGFSLPSKAQPPTQWDISIVPIPPKIISVRRE